MKTTTFKKLLAALLFTASISGCGESSSPAKVLSVSLNHACAIADKVVTCWGDDPEGTGVLVTPTAFGDAFDIVTGFNYACGRFRSGIHCWGGGSAGLNPVPVIANPVKMASGANHVCVVDWSSVQCWFAQDNPENDPGLITPPSFSNTNNITGIAAGWYHTCVIESGNVVCWGNPPEFFDVGQTNVPTNRIVHATAISSYFLNTCVADDKATATTVDDEVICWGGEGSEFDFGQNNVPDNVPSGEEYSAIGLLAVGSTKSCVTDNWYNVSCWGDDTVPVSGRATRHAISLGFDQACISTDESGVVCWSYTLEAPDNGIVNNIPSSLKR